LLAGIKQVAEGQTAFDPEAMRLGMARWHPLSERERALVKLMMDGRSNDEIGRELGIASKTVETHLTRLYERLGVETRTELALKVEREGWLDVPRR
jgi:DNA-binding NarL/FixJ family response regulator